MSKFKVGDEVVLINPNSAFYLEKRIVEEVKGDQIFTSRLTGNGLGYRNAEEYILLEIYDSPLYQALKEIVAIEKE